MLTHKSKAKPASAQRELRRTCRVLLGNGTNCGSAIEILMHMASSSALCSLVLVFRDVMSRTAAEPIACWRKFPSKPTSGRVVAASWS